MSSRELLRIDPPPSAPMRTLPGAAFAALLDALEGVELTDAEVRMLDQLANMSEESALRLATVIRRARIRRGLPVDATRIARVKLRSGGAVAVSLSASARSAFIDGPNTSTLDLNELIRVRDAIDDATEWLLDQEGERATT